MKRFGIIGAGVVGTALGIILCEQGWELCGVYDSRPEAAQQLAERTGAKALNPGDVSRLSEILFITTNDSAIAGTCNCLAEAGAFHPGQIVVHMSGAQTSEILLRAQEFGALVLSVHPLQSFASPEMAVQNLPGSVFSIEGERDAYDVAVNLVETLGGEYFFIDKRSKPLYHAGACVVSNYLVTLVDFGVRLLESTGIPYELATKALIPLISGTVNNINKIGVPKALTGPIARGDLSTIIDHLSCLTEQAPELLQLYSRLGLETVKVAKNKGSINNKEFEALQRVFLRELAGKATVNKEVR